MKKILIIILMLAPMSMFAQKFAHFNMADVLPNMAEYKTASEEIQQLSNRYQEEYDRLTKEYQTKADEFQKISEDKQTPEAILQSKYQDLQKMGQTIQEFGQASQQDIEKQQTEKLQLIQSKVMAALQKLGEAAGYIYIVDISNGVIPFVNTAMSTDITNSLKVELGIK